MRRIYVLAIICGVWEKAGGQTRREAYKLYGKVGYAEFEQLDRKYDIIIPKGENMPAPMRDYYAYAPYHHRKDMGTYLSGTVCYFGNIYVMRRNIFSMTAVHGCSQSYRSCAKINCTWY